MAAKSGKFSLSHSAFIHRKRLFVLMKASWRFGNRAHSETEQHTRPRLGVTLKVAVQSSLALSSCNAILRQCKVIHSDFDITRAFQQFARQFIKRALLAGHGYIFIFVAPLRGLDPGHARKAVERDPIRPQLDRLLDRVRETFRNLAWQTVNQIVIDGLPRQIPEGFANTVEKTIELRPDRIALYSFARVPWIKPAQRSYKDEDIPVAGEKRALYELARELLEGAGYIEIGMDHFALPQDGIARAQRQGTLHRNFQGYTETRTSVLLGLGVSAISETPTCFHQNEKAFPVYERRVREGELPTLRGHLLTEEERRLREQILRFMTRFAVELRAEQAEDARVFLDSMFDDGLVEVRERNLILTERGRPFLRNACMFFDQRLRSQEQRPQVFSQAL